MQKKKLAVVTARADECEQRDILGGIMQAAFHLQADVTVFTNIYNYWVQDELLNYENVIYEAFDPAQFDGVIVTAEAFMSLSILADVLERIRESGTPCILLGGEAEGFDSIDADDAADFESIAEHLVAVHGFRTIDLLTGPKENAVSRLRTEGCRRAFARLGVPLAESRIHEGDFWTSSGEALARRYLSGELPMPQAVVCLNDYMAFGLCDTLTEAGVAIPERLSVTGYDHHDSRIYHSPLLTTFRRNRRGLGVEAVNRLLGGSYAVIAEERFFPGDTCTCGTNGRHLADETRRVRIGQYHTTMNSVAQFASRLTLCRTLTEYTAVLAEHFYLLHGAESLFLCLDSGWQEERPDGRELIVCGIRDGRASEPRQVPRNALMEALRDASMPPDCLYLLPLVFQKRCFGYAALRYTGAGGYDASLRDFLKTAANSLEFLRMKSDIRYLNQCLRESALHDALTGFVSLREFRQQAEDAPILAVLLTFRQEDDALRTDATAAVANALKRICRRPERCCRTENGFLIACEGSVLPDMVKAAIRHETAARFTEQQLLIAFAEAKGTDAALKAAAAQAAADAEAVRRRQEHPHYAQLLRLRRQNMAAPEKIPDTDKASRRLQLSEGYFRSVYKQCFGVSYGNDCIATRLNCAKYLLATTAMSIYAIAMRCGYADEKYFARQFRQHAGCSPVQYRNGREEP